MSDIQGIGLLIVLLLVGLFSFFVGYQVGRDE
jgi:hypothetical protein